MGRGKKGGFHSGSETLVSRGRRRGAQIARGHEVSSRTANGDEKQNGNSIGLDLLESEGTGCSGDGTGRGEGADGGCLRTKGQSRRME